MIQMLTQIIKVKINSNGLMISVSLLLISLIIVVSTSTHTLTHPRIYQPTHQLTDQPYFKVLSIHLNGWKLTKKLGVIIMLSYASFLVLSILIETNVFFQVNLPTCQH